MIITKPYTFSIGTVIVASEHNSDFDVLYNCLNGNISNTNIKASAGITDDKLATITTAGKVNLTALVAGSQATGDIIYKGASGYARLPIGTTGQKLKPTPGDITGTCMTVAYDSGELAAATDQISITGLDGDTDEEYELIVRAVNDNAGAMYYGVRPNADGGSNYGYQYATGNSSTASATRNTSQGFIWLGSNVNTASGDITFCSAKIMAKSGYVRTAIVKAASKIVTTTVTQVDLIGQSWNNTADNITSLVVFSGAADGLGIGSRVILLKKSSTPTTKTWEEIYTKTIGNGNLLTNGNFEGWVGGTSSAPDGWTLYTSTIAREASTIKVGTYSAKLTNVGEFYQDFHTAKGIAYWKGKTITAGCWVYATGSDRARIHIYDGVDIYYSSSHTGDSTWQWLTVTHAISNTADRVRITCEVHTTASTSYFDGAVCVEAATLASTVSTENFEATSLTIPSLTGNSDCIYRLRARVVNGYNGNVGYYFRLNNDSGANIYGYQTLDGTNTTVSATRGTGSGFLPYANCGALNQISVSNLLLYAKSGFVRTGINEITWNIATTTVNAVTLIGNSYNETATEVTRMDIIADQANGLGIGTNIVLERLNL